MARKRMIDPNIWQSEDFAKLSPFARLVFIGLFSNADDDGRGRAKPVYLKSILFPYDETIKVSDVEKALVEISRYMSVIFYTVEDKEFYILTSWNNFQVINKHIDSKIPQPCVIDGATVGLLYDYGSSTVGLPPNRIEKNRIEKNRIEYMSGLENTECNIEKPKKPNALSENQKKQDICRIVIDYLNEKAGTLFRATSERTKAFIKARQNEGFVLDDFKKVIDNKVDEWKNDEKMCKYLRPETLFSPKFEGYLNQKGGKYESAKDLSGIMRV